QVVAQPTLLSRRTAQAHDRVSCRSREQDIGNAQERRSLPCPTHHAVVSRLSQPLSRANFTASFRVETSNFANRDFSRYFTVLGDICSCFAISLFVRPVSRMRKVSSSR